MKLWPFSRASSEDTEVATRSTHYNFETFSYVVGSSQNFINSSILSLPPFWCAINFISRTMASMPLQVFSRDDQKTPINTTMSRKITESPYPNTSSRAWRQSLFAKVLTHGRAIAIIERNNNGTLRNIRCDLTHASLLLNVSVAKTGMSIAMLSVRYHAGPQVM